MSDSPYSPYSPEAKAWIDALESGAGVCGAWRLEVLDQRSRRRWTESVSECRPASASDSPLSPTRIRRSADGLPRSLVDGAVRYLISRAPYSGIVFEGEPVEGVYVPTRTTWTRDRGMNGRDGTYTLVQDLVRADMADGALGLVTSASCLVEQETEWHWDETDVAVDVPVEQGVSVSVQGVSRNEDGTIDYAVVTRRALTHDSGWIETECDEFRTVSRRVWDNVYGQPGDARADGVPAPCESRGADGALLKVEWRLNEDCTWRVEAERTVPRPVEAAQRSARATLSGVSVSVLDRNMSGESFAEAVSRLRPGESVEVRVTEAGLYDVERTVHSDVSVGETAASATQTRFRVEAERRENVPRSAAECGLDVELGDVPSGCAVERAEVRGGSVRTVEARVTDAGTVDVTERVVHENGVRDAQMSARRTLAGVTETHLDRSQETYGDFAQIVRDLPVGGSVEIRATDAGLYDIETTVPGDAPAGETAASATQTRFKVEAETRENVPRADAECEMEVDLADVPSGCAVESVEVRGGSVRTVEARVTDAGTVDVTRRVSHERGVKDAQLSARRTLTGVTVTRLDRSQETYGDFDRLVGDLSVGDSVEIRTTDAGLYDIERTTLSDVSVGETAASATQTAFKVEAETRRNVPRSAAEAELDVSLADEPGGRAVTERTVVRGGSVRTVEARVTDAGTVDVTERVVHERNVPKAQRSARRTLTGVTVTTLERSRAPMSDESFSDAVGRLGPGDSIEVRVTDASLADVETVDAAMRPYGNTAVSVKLDALRRETRVTANVDEMSLSDPEVLAPILGLEHEFGHAVTKSYEVTENGTVNVTVADVTDEFVGGKGEFKSETGVGVGEDPAGHAIDYAHVTGARHVSKSRTPTALVTELSWLDDSESYVMGLVRRQGTKYALNVGDALEATKTETGRWDHRFRVSEFLADKTYYKTDHPSLSGGAAAMAMKSWETFTSPTLARVVNRFAVAREKGRTEESPYLYHSGAGNRRAIDHRKQETVNAVSVPTNEGRATPANLGLYVEGDFSVAESNGYVHFVEPSHDGMRFSRSMQREADGTFTVEETAEYERIGGTAESDENVVVYTLETPTSLIFIRNYERLLRKDVSVALQYIHDAVEEWRTRMNVGAMGNQPSSVVPNVDISRDQFGLWNVRTSITVTWPPGSGGPYGSLADTTFWEVSIADTRFAAGRGGSALEDYVRRKGANAFLTDPGNAAAAIVNGYKRFLNASLATYVGLQPALKSQSWLYDQTSGGLLVDFFEGDLYNVDRPSLNVDTANANWTTSFTRVPAYKVIKRLSTSFNQITETLYELVVMKATADAAAAAANGTNTNANTIGEGSEGSEGGLS